MQAVSLIKNQQTAVLRGRQSGLDIKLYPRKGVGGVSGLLNRILDATGNDHLYDCDWTPLPLADCYAYASNQTPMYRRWGNVVEVYGAAKPKAQVSAGGSVHIGTLPEHYRPPRSNHCTIYQGSSNNIWMLEVSNNGELWASRYRTGATNNAITTGNWLPFCVTFLV